MNINNIRRLTTGAVRANEPMSKHTTFRTGGPAKLYIVPRTTAELAALIRYFKLNGLDYFILGNGSNLLVSDAGYHGAVIDLGRNDDTEFTLLGYEWLDDKLIMDVGAGCFLSAVGNIAANIGASGFEELSGIPGCMGGACIMNAGAYGRELKDIVLNVTAVDNKGNVVKLNKDELQFRYRGSNLMDDGYIVCRAEIELARGEADAVKARCNELMAKRKESQPLEYPSAGSTFKRPEGFYAGKLISDAGLKGLRIGGAEVSEKHAGFIVNRGGAVSQDIYSLINDVRARVLDIYGVELQPEVRFLGTFTD